MRACTNCGKEWEVITRRDKLRKSCSDACFRELISKANLGKGKKPDPVCVYCSKEFRRPKLRVALSKQKYCSTECRLAYKEKQVQ